MTRRFTAFVVAFLGLAAMSAAHAQDKIGIKFIGGQNGGAGLKLITDAKAGVPNVAQSHWNCLSGTNGTAVTLKADDGTDTKATVDYKSPAIWAVGNDASKGADYALTDGYLDSTADTDDASVPIVTVSKIPYATYDVYVYFDTDQPGKHRKGMYKIGDASMPVLANDSFSGTYTKSDAQTSGNYVVFAKQTGAMFSLKAIPVSSDDGYARCDVAAVQIVKR